MEISISPDATELGKEAGKRAALLIRKAIAAKGAVNIILATGTSQLQTLQQLVTERDIDWSKVVMFHLDEYIGLPVTAKASFRKYLKERFIAKLPSLITAHLINGEADAEEECARLGNLIRKHPIDVALVGIGENGHLAFNDPPADFDTEQAFIVVQLDDACRQQQLNEGWFEVFADVPKAAISMSVKQIMRSKHIICSVPDKRKAIAVKNTLDKEVDKHYPASILRIHPDCTLFLDEDSAMLLSQKIRMGITRKNP